MKTSVLGIDRIATVPIQNQVRQAFPLRSPPFQVLKLGDWSCAFLGQDSQEGLLGMATPAGLSYQGQQKCGL